MRNKIILTVIIALVLAALTARVLFVGKWIVPISWGIIAVVIGWLWSTSKKDAFRIGALFGGVLSAAFLVIGKDWSIPTQVGPYTLFLLLGTAFGALCGGFASWIGFAVFQRKKPAQ